MLIVLLDHQLQRAVTLPPAATRYNFDPAIWLHHFRRAPKENPALEDSAGLQFGGCRGVPSLIAEGLGFAEASNFAKFFKREAGLTPLQFRRRHAGR